MLADKIRNLRKENKISQEELAEKLGVSRQSVSLWENGQTTPSLENIVVLANIFNVSTDVLLNENTPAPITEEQPEKSTKARLNKKWIITGVSVALLVAISTIAFILLRPFSESTLSMANAEKSVVKIYCYDENNNEVATGSGFIVFEKNVCVTNYHVLADAYTYKISTNEDITLLAEGIVACSEEKDIAIIKLQEDSKLKPLAIGDSDKIKKGETVTAIGSPLGLKNTISQGILSGRIMLNDMDVLQITAPISNGSSGGALFDDNGKVIGVTFASYEEGQNLNLSIPINEVEDLYKWCGPEKETNHIFLESHPEYKYIDRYSHIQQVSIANLKEDPSLYDDKIIKLNTKVSSTYDDGEVCFVAEEKEVSGNLEYDYKLYNSTNFENNPFIHIISGSECNYSQRNLNPGEDVIIIGKFYYEAIGDTYTKRGSTLTRTKNFAAFRAYLVYSSN